MLAQNGSKKEFFNNAGTYQPKNLVYLHSTLTPCRPLAVPHQAHMDANSWRAGGLLESEQPSTTMLLNLCRSGRESVAAGCGGW